MHDHDSDDSNQESRPGGEQGLRHQWRLERLEGWTIHEA